MNTYYRFRSSERLLGRAATKDKEARPGELDELTIYFASPLELNDPLEGHRETFFEGDIIVWKNLLKHYSLILFSSAIKVYIQGEDGEIQYINLRPESYAPETANIALKVASQVLADTVLMEYAEAIAHTKRRVSRAELTVHLMTVHSRILTHVLKELSGHFPIDDLQRYLTVEKSFTDFIALRALDIKAEGSNPDISTYREIKSKIKQQALRGNALRDTVLSKGAMRIYLNFPEEYAQQIDYLIYPHWYVACFMESCENPAIWGSYGDNHKGICLIYETDRARGADTLRFKRLPHDYIRALNYGKPNDQWFLDMECQLPLIKVRYDSSYTSTNFFTSLLNENKEWALSYWYSDGDKISPCSAWLDGDIQESFRSYRKKYEQSVATKTAHWENETERRIIITGFPFDQTERVASYNFYDLKGLIFGINTSDEVKVQIIRKIAEHCKIHRRSDFRFYQARYSDSYDKIEHDLLSYITFNVDGSLNLDAGIG
ncbi:DUF2971 domain-containing protein [Pseudomonas putida]|uniref:DUF2971 domain-containing protein n=1 Tax=Pseudomonas putida TaxID=303 RepID=UPI003CFF910A